MKKLMIAVAVVAAAVAANAGAFNWQTSGSSNAPKIYMGGTTTTLYNWGNGDGALGTYSTILLLDNAVVEQSSLLTTLRGATDASTAFAGLSKVDSTTLSETSKIASKETGAYGVVDQTYDLYYAILATDKAGNDYVLISKLLEDKIVQASDPTDVKFTGNDSMSKAAIQGLDKSFADAGWYQVSAAAVPEPTSGLLLLISMAGLALRRRRA